MLAFFELEPEFERVMGVGDGAFGVPGSAATSLSK